MTPTKASRLPTLPFGTTLPFGAPQKVERFVLENGLRVLLLPDRSAPLIALQLWFKVGSRHEKKGKTGLAHLFEHLMFNQFESLAAGEFDVKMESMGADNNASTWLDFTQYQEAFPKKHLRAVLELEAHRMTSLVLESEPVAREKEVVMNERRYRVDDDVDGAAEELLYKTAFSAHPYHSPTIGWMKDIEGLSPQDCKQFYAQYYCPNNATLVLVGDLSPARALSLVSRAFGHIPQAEVPEEDTHFDPPQTTGKQVAVELPTATSKLQVGFLGPALGDEDHVLACLLVEVLTSGNASRLHQRMVYRDQIASEVAGFVGPHRDPSLIEFSASAREEADAQTLLLTLETELEKLRSQPISNEELERAKARFEFSQLGGMETAEGKASQLGFYDTLLGNPVAAWERLERAQRAQASDLRRVARRYLRPERQTSVLVSPSTPEAGA